MTAAERQKRYRDKKRREREAQPAGEAGAEAQGRPGPQARRAGGREGRCRRHPASGAGDAVRPGRVWCDVLTVTKGEGEPLRLLKWERAFLTAVEAGSAAGGRTDRKPGPTPMAWFGFKEAAGGWRMVYPFRRVQDNACDGRGRAVRFRVPPGRRARLWHLRAGR